MVVWCGTEDPSKKVSVDSIVIDENSELSKLSLLS